MKAASRNGRSGFVLLSVLAMTIILSMLLAVYQVRVQGSNLVLARLMAAYLESTQELEMHERLRGIIGLGIVGSVSGAPLDGTPFTLSVGHEVFSVSVQDSSGLPDLYLSSAAVLGLLPVDTGKVLQGRQHATELYGDGIRLPSLAMTLAVFGLDGEADTLSGLSTDRNQSGGIAAETAPAVFREAAVQLQAADFELRKGERFLIRVERLRE